MKGNLKWGVFALHLRSATAEGGFLEIKRVKVLQEG